MDLVEGILLYAFKASICEKLLNASVEVGRKLFFLDQE
jgi:hypothetical protein